MHIVPVISKILRWRVRWGSRKLVKWKVVIRSSPQFKEWFQCRRQLIWIGVGFGGILILSIQRRKNRNFMRNSIMTITNKSKQTTKKSIHNKTANKKSTKKERKRHQIKPRMKQPLQSSHNLAQRSDQSNENL